MRCNAIRFEQTRSEVQEMCYETWEGECSHHDLTSDDVAIKGEAGGPCGVRCTGIS